MLELSDDTADFRNAASLLRAAIVTYADSDPVGRHWLERAEHHLNGRLDRSFRDHPPLTSEQVALSMLKDLGLKLRSSGEALKRAAEQLNRAGVGMAANEAMQAGKRAVEAAQGLTD